MKELNPYKKRFIAAIIAVSLGLTLNTILDQGSVGKVFIAIGGLLFISAMALKKKENQSKNES